MGVILRTSDAAPIGGNLDDVQVAFKVSAIDEDTGIVLYSDWLQFSSKGLSHDVARVEEFVSLASESWYDQNSDAIAQKQGIVEAKAVELATVSDLVVAVNEYPDAVKAYKAEVVDQPVEEVVVP